MRLLSSTTSTLKTFGLLNGFHFEESESAEEHNKQMEFGDGTKITQASGQVTYEFDAGRHIVRRNLGSHVSEAQEWLEPTTRF